MDCAVEKLQKFRLSLNERAYIESSKIKNLLEGVTALVNTNTGLDAAIKSGLQARIQAIDELPKSSEAHTADLTKRINEVEDMVPVNLARRIKALEMSVPPELAVTLVNSEKFFIALKNAEASLKAEIKQAYQSMKEMLNERQ